MSNAVRLSPLHPVHQSAGATLTTLNDWQVATAVGPTGGAEAAAREGLAIADLTDKAKVIVEGPGAGAAVRSAFGAPELGINEGALLDDGALGVYSLRPDRFYVRAETGQEQAIIEKANGATGELVTATDETDGRSEILLVGPNADICLSRVCGLDFHPDEFPNHTAKQTSVAKIRQLIIRNDIGNVPAYILSGGRSYAIYLWETLVEAGQDLNIRPIGRDVVNAL